MKLGPRSESLVTLLVEDNEDDADLTKMAFREAKVINPLVRVRDGQEALDYLFARGSYADRDPTALPLVVLLDIKLPKLSGIEVLREIRAGERTRRLPVVILTSSIEDRDRVGAYDLHCNSYVRKPVDYDKFVDACRELGVYWTTLNTPPPEPGR
jgi:two-component system, response regulator